MGFFTSVTQVDKRILIADVTTKKAIMDIIKSLKEILSDIRYPRKLKNMGDYYAEVVAVVNPDGSSINDNNSVVRGGAKGATTAADVTSSNAGTDAQALDVMPFVQHSDGTLSRMQSTENGALHIGNASKKFRDGFALGYIDTAVWDATWINQGAGFVSFGGNSNASSYLRVNLDPYLAGTEFRLTSKETFKFPVRLGYGLSRSLAILGQEASVELVAVDNNGVVAENNSIPITPISGTVTITTNVATINFASPHPFKGGDRVSLYANTESRLNVPNVAATIVSPTQITVPCTLANGTYTAGGYVHFSDIFAYAKNAVGLICENTSATNATFATRRNGSSYRGINSTISTTAAVQSNTSPYTDAFNSAMDTEINVGMEDALYVSKAIDGLGAAAGNGRWGQGIPDEEFDYKLRLRFKQSPSFSKIAANIISSSKAGTTTATLVTDRPHNLVTGNLVQVYGCLDQTNFPNLTAAVACTVINPTTFQVIQGTASTTSTTGGIVCLNNGSVTLPGAINLAVASISRNSNVLTVTMNTTASGLIPGEMAWVGGMTGSASAYNGAYKTLAVAPVGETTTYKFESIGANFGSIATGGAVVKLADFRMHYIRSLEYTRLVAELSNSRGAADLSRATPVQGSVSISSGTITTGNVQNIINTLVADVASAAITTSTTTAAITPTMGVSFQVNIPVTAVTGANPTLDIAIECSDDTGTNWVRIYEFPRITATGIYRSPLLLMLGNRLRYVQTVGGTAPSFTRAINRLQSNAMPPLFLQFFDRALVPNTLNSTTATWFTESTDSVNIVIAMGAAATPPTLALQGSMDGIDWFQIGANIIPTANSATFVQVSNVQSRFNRMLVTSAGTGATLKYISTQFLGR